MLSDEERNRYQAWVCSVGPQAIAYARSLTRDIAQADDIVQECLYRLLRRADQYDLEADGIKLLFTSISNLCINQSTRKKTLLSLDGSGNGDDQNLLVSDHFAFRPDEILQLKEMEEMIRGSILRLPAMQRAAVELRALDMSKEEIGAVLGVSASHAGVLVFRGRQALAKDLAPYLGLRNPESL